MFSSSRLFRGRSLGECLAKSAASVERYLMLVMSASEKMSFAYQFVPSEGRVELVSSSVSHDNVYLGNELRLVISNVVSDSVNSLVLRRLCELMLSECVVSEAFFCARLPSSSWLRFTAPSLEGHAKRLLKGVGGGAWIHICVALLEGVQGGQTASMAFFNGRSPFLGPPEPSLVASVSAGLQQSMLGIQLRLFRDPDASWRQYGEYQSSGGRLEQLNLALCITVSLHQRDNGSDEFDGANCKDIEAPALSCAIKACAALQSRTKTAELQNRRAAHRGVIRTSAAPQMAALIAAIHARASPMIRDELTTELDKVAFHGETVSQVLCRVVTDLYADP